MAGCTEPDIFAAAVRFRTRITRFAARKAWPSAPFPSAMTTRPPVSRIGAAQTVRQLGTHFASMILSSPDGNGRSLIGPQERYHDRQRQRTTDGDDDTAAVGRPKLKPHSTERHEPPSAAQPGRRRHEFGFRRGPHGRVGRDVERLRYDGAAPRHGLPEYRKDFWDAGRWMPCSRD